MHFLTKNTARTFDSIAYIILQACIYKQIDVPALFQMIFLGQYCLLIPQNLDMLMVHLVF